MCKAARQAPALFWRPIPAIGHAMISPAYRCRKIRVNANHLKNSAGFKHTKHAVSALGWSWPLFRCGVARLSEQLCAHPLRSGGAGTGGDPAFLSAQANLTVAQERANQAFANVMPQINASGNTNKNHRVYTTSGTFSTTYDEKFNSDSAQINLTQAVWRNANRA